MAIDLTIDTNLENLQAIESKLTEYKKKYRLLLPYFYKIFQLDKLGKHAHFVNWDGLYHIKLKQIRHYEKVLLQVIGSLPLYNQIKIAEVI